MAAVENETSAYCKVTNRLTGENIQAIVNKWYQGGDAGLILYDIAKKKNRTINAPYEILWDIQTTENSLTD